MGGGRGTLAPHPHFLNRGSRAQLFDEVLETRESFPGGEKTLRIVRVGNWILFHSIDAMCRYFQSKLNIYPPTLGKTGELRRSDDFI